jgi:hypothetical protein
MWILDNILNILKTTSTVVSMSVKNAENYAFFALAHWYYIQDWGSGRTPALFSLGYAVRQN